MLTDLRQGDAITDDWAMVTANLVRRSGGTGVLTLVCAPNVAGGGGGGGPAVQKALSELWTLRSRVRQKVMVRVEKRLADRV